MSEENKRNGEVPAQPAGEQAEEPTASVGGGSQGVKAADENASTASAVSEPAAAPGGEAAAEAEKLAREQARAEARAARAAARNQPNAAAEGEAAETAEPKAPSPKQPFLDLLVGTIRQSVAEEAVEHAYINEVNGHLPSLVIREEHWLNTAALLREHEAFRFHYLRNVSGVDQETHLEVVYHLLSLETGVECAVKVRTDRNSPSIRSVTPVWLTADWNEREIFDLLGVEFAGHPDLRRIMMPDDWVGHPLRKDYEPIDPEV